MKRIFLLFLLINTVILSFGYNTILAEKNGFKTALSSPASHLSADEFITTLKPSKVQSKTCKNILKKLKGHHYLSTKINDRLSEKVFNNFLSDLDSFRAYFLAKDIKEFEIYRYQIDDALKSGNIILAFDIYNRYQRRIIEGLVYLINYINRNIETMDFDIDEKLDTDRENKPWPENNQELHDLWRKRLKNRIISLKLSGKSLEEIKSLLNKRYRSQLNRVAQINNEDVFRTFMNSFTQIFDPHTQYLSPRVSKNFDIQMSLSLEGIGAVLQSKNEYIQVIRLIPAGPADKAGQLKAGDRIAGVGQGTDGEIVDVVGWRIDDVVDLIRGPKKTVVRLEIVPSDEQNEHSTKIISITRNTVKLEEQAAQKEIIDLEYNGKRKKIGIITLLTFYIDFSAYQTGDLNYRSSTRDVHEILNEFRKAKVDGVIIDLRDNSGGALQEANELVGLFIEKGPTVQVRDANGRIMLLDDPDPKIVYKGPLVVLVNRMSASASEIFAGAIQDYNRGVIVGTQTYGKGTVQSLMRLKRGQIKLTSAKFYRISGKSTQSQGIIPDITYPSKYDLEKFGENTLPKAMPCDSIKPTSYESYPVLQSLIAKLNKNHKNRIKDAHGFQKLTAEIEYQKKIKNKKTISLREATRKTELEKTKQWRFNLENQYRIAEGLKPLETIEDFEAIDESEDDEDDPDNDKNKPDPLLTESEYILFDIISFNNNKLFNLSEMSYKGFYGLLKMFHLN